MLVDVQLAWGDFPFLPVKLTINAAVQWNMKFLEFTNTLTTLAALSNF